MDSLASALKEVAQQVWATMLGLDLRAVADEIILDSHPSEELLTTTVEIHGDWTGSLVLVCPVALGHRVAAAMVGTEPAVVKLEDAVDAVGEIANVVAGNLKPILGHSCRCSRPQVRRGTLATPELDPTSRTLVHQAFLCEAWLLRFLVREDGTTHAES